MLVISMVGIPAYPVGLGLAFSHSYDRVADPLSIHWLLFLPDACVLTLLSVRSMVLWYNASYFFPIIFPYSYLDRCILPEWLPCHRDISFFLFAG